MRVLGTSGIGSSEVSPTPIVSVPEVFAEVGFPSRCFPRAGVALCCGEPPGHTFSRKLCYSFYETNVFVHIVLLS